MKAGTAATGIKPRVDAQTLMINEIFYSIQGESTHAGKPCVFVRLTYCNLRCVYCDTAYAFYEGSPMALCDVLKKVASYHCSLVEITGGEPLLQPAVLSLMKQLCDQGYQVLLETSGSRSVRRVDPRVIKIMDIKCPSSAMAHKNFPGNLDYLLPHDEVKFVLGDRRDYEWAKAFIRTHGLHQKVHAILFSPVFEWLAPATLANWMLEDHLQKQFPNVRLQLQLHKYIWSPDQRGV